MAFLSFYRKPQPRGYSKQSYLIEDGSETSPLYFDVTEIPQMTGGGRYVIKLKGNGLNLRTGTTIDVEIIDSEGGNIYAEVLNYTDRFNNYYIMVEIYDTTPQGLATVYLVGEASIDPRGNGIPRKHQEVYNVRWQKQVNVLPFERNTAELSFNDPPQVNIVQVITPERALISQQSASISGSSFSVYTSSINDMSIVTANFEGYDRDFASSPDILDKRLQSILLNPLQKPSTENTVNSSRRTRSTEIQNGYMRDYTNRFNTIVSSASGSIRKDFLGGAFNFYSSQSVPGVLQPTPPSNYSVSGSVADQLAEFSANIIEVMSSTNMRISKPIEVSMYNSTAVQSGYTTKYKYKKASSFTASISYVPNNPAFVTSSTVSQSYLETTFTDFKPISGEVYRIKTYYKRGVSTGEYKLIYDHVVTPVEYLTDAIYPNQTTYARRESDYRLTGHFTEQSIADEYWECAIEIPGGIYTAPTPTISSGSLLDSISIPADYTESGIFTTAFYQNYNINQIYTLSLTVAIDPNTELEVYMSSDPLSINTTQPASSPRAFLKDPNLEKTRYTNAYNRFGKLVGKISNNSSVSKYYGKVEFDYETDGEGFGRPLFRTSTISRANTTGSAYVSEISIKPIAVNGFTPSIVQFAIPFNSEITEVLSLSQSLDFKLEYFDYTGKQSEYTTYINDLVVNLKGEIPSNTCQAETTNFYAPSSYENY